jgi:hypothetical protein
MEVLFGAIISVIMEFYKKLMSKYGKKVTDQIVHLGVFVGVLVWVVLTQQNIISEHTVSFIIKVFSVSIATYEIVIKRFLSLMDKDKCKKI